MKKTLTAIALAGSLGTAQARDVLMSDYPSTATISHVISENPSTTESIRLFLQPKTYNEGNFELPNGYSLIGDNSIIVGSTEVRGNNQLENIYWIKDVEGQSYKAIRIRGRDISEGDNVLIDSNSFIGSDYTGDGIAVTQDHATSITVQNCYFTRLRNAILVEAPNGGKKFRNNIIEDNYRGFYSRGNTDFGTEEEHGNNILYGNELIAIIDRRGTRGSNDVDFAQYNYIYDKQGNLLRSEEEILPYVQLVTDGARGSNPYVIFEPTNTVPHPDYPDNNNSRITNWEVYQ